MKKLSAKILSYTLAGLVGAISLFALWAITNAQTTVPGWFDNQDTSYNPNVPNSATLTGDSLLDGVKNFINWMLGILALIALIMLIFWGFQMVTAAGDDGKYKKWFKILQQAGIGLAFIWLSWLVISLIFRLIGIITA